MKVFQKKIPAGALQYTLFISVLILLLISAFISLTYLQQAFKVKTNSEIQCIQNATTGFNYYATHQIPYHQKDVFQLDKALKSELLIEKTPWGFFDILKVESTIQNSRFEKLGLMGGYSIEKPALYLKDLNNALVVVGNAKISGKSYLPLQFVKSGNIAGNSYYGSQLIYGETAVSSDQLPSINNIDIVKELSLGFMNTENLNFIELYEGMEAVHSFKEPTNIYQQQGTIALNNIKLSGNYIIQSTTLITVTNTAFLSDVILIAPSIIIQSEVQGNFQAIASTSIKVGENCHLNYPTALVVFEHPTEDIQENTVETTPFFIDTHTTIKGVVAYLNTNEEANYTTQLFISENTEITGEVYCDKNLELLGTVYGLVTTSSFIAKQAGSVYLNHLYNGQIIQDSLPKQYVGISFEQSIPKAIKWLY